MIKIIITEEDPVYRGHTRLKKGWTGYTTKETEKVTARYDPHPSASEFEKGVKMTYVRFAAGLLGYEGREPIYCWVQNTHTLRK